MLVKENVLFLECGSSGLGGSYLSLRDHIEIMTEHLDKKIIVLANPSVYEDDYRALGCEVIKIKHPIYSSQSKVKWLFNKCLSISTRISPWLVCVCYRLFEINVGRKLENIARKYHITLLHLNNQPIRNFSGFMAARRAGLPVVSHIRTLHTYGFSNIFAKYLNYISPKFISISGAVEKEWKKYNIKSDIIYNPVLLEQPEAPSSKIYDLIYVGRLVGGKGIERLLEEISQFPVPPKLAILGDGPLKEKLQERVKKLGLGGQVVFLGHVKRVSSLILQSKILVLPTENEGMGRVIIEAMKLGVPVIANKVGGVKELICHNNTGLLYDANIKGQLKKEVQYLLDNEALQEKLSGLAFEWASHQFSDAKYRESMEKVYQKANSNIMFGNK